MIPLPDGIEFQEWSARIVEDYSLDGIPEGMPWRDFGAQLLTYNSIPDIPRTDGFDDWREWARRCMGSFL